MYAAFYSLGRSQNSSLVLRFQSEIVDADAKLAHFLLKVLPVHPGPLGGARDIAAGGPERVDEEIALPLPEEFFLGLAEFDLAAVFRCRSGGGHGRRPRRIVIGGGMGVTAGRAAEQFRCGDLGARG